MEKKYINESRYKKGHGRKRRDSSTVRNNLSSSKVIKERKQIKKKLAIINRNKVKKKTQSNKLANIIICSVLLIIIAIISRAILKDKNEPFISFSFIEQANEQVINIGIITDENLLNSNSKNLVLNELNKYYKDMLLEINQDYSITYKCISNVTKVSNKEYILTRNEDSNITITNIKEGLEGYIKDKQSVYYEKLKHIEDIQVIDENKLNIKLNMDSPYFIYSLDICLPNAYGVTNYLLDNSSTHGKLVLTRHKKADKQLPSKVVVTKYKDMYAVVQAYKNKEINMFITNSENVTNMLGKYEYNIKSYRNGETLFLFGNPQSKIYLLDEVRKVIAYSIDRDSIIKDVLKNKGDKIDLPYIYDSVKYKYDVYAAENILLTNEYKKVGKVYTKTKNGVKTVLELDLLVNKSDETKVSVANKIKNNLSALGTKINIEKLTEEKIQQRIKKGTYDLVLANVNLNNVPDISFIIDNNIISDDVKQVVNKINSSTVQDISENIVELQTILSNTVSVIGIYSDVSYLVYSKDIVGINNVSYMNLFKEILTI